MCHFTGTGCLMGCALPPLPLTAPSARKSWAASQRLWKSVSAHDGFPRPDRPAPGYVSEGNLQLRPSQKRAIVAPYESDLPLCMAGRLLHNGAYGRQTPWYSKHAAAIFGTVFGCLLVTYLNVLHWKYPSVDLTPIFFALVICGLMCFCLAVAGISGRVLPGPQRGPAKPSPKQLSKNADSGP